jgi:hypothetical protein
MKKFSVEEVTFRFESSPQNLAFDKLKDVLKTGKAYLKGDEMLCYAKILEHLGLIKLVPVKDGGREFLYHLQSSSFAA